MAVGGTDLAGSVEEAWADGGGGESEINVKPAYQLGVGPYPNDGVRDVPDIAALAGNPGVQTFAGGRVGAAAGTSAAAPQWAAAWAILNQSVKARFPDGIQNAHVRLYQLGQAGLGMNDITTGTIVNGSQGTFPAGPGYDLATGWGTPNVLSLTGNW
jgi:kumamolisin